MARGPKKHLKRLHAPHHWMLGKLDGIWAPRPSTGPHKMRECLPLCIILRNRLKYALNMQEVKQICMQKVVQVDGRVRTDTNFPAGFMDVVSIPKSNDSFRLLFDTKGRFVLNRIDDKESGYKLCRVKKQDFSARGVPTIVTHDGRTIRYPDPIIKVNDTVKVDLATGKVMENGVIKFEAGVTAMVTKGRNCGRVGEIVHVEKHPGSFDIVFIKDKTGKEFSTRLSNVFAIGKDGETWVQLCKGNGIKLNIFEERQKARADK